jgi:hypothetical protein
MADKDNIQSPSVEKMIPQQMVGDSQALIEFLKEYYRFLNQDNEPIDVVNKIIENKDLDDAVDSYIDMIRKELGYGMARELEANKINLYKHIGEFYRAKGSIDSFKLLFRLLFNKNVEISLPKEQILIASDGRWVQQTSLFAEITSGNAFDLVNNFIIINNPSGTAVTVEVERVRKYNDEGIYEIVISRLFVGEIENNSTFTENNISGTIVNSLSGFTIDYPGKNFKVGQLLDVVYGQTIGTKIKVTSVNTNGGITGIEFLNFGVGYPEEFSAQLVPVGFDYNFNVQETTPGDPSALTYSGRLNEITSVSEYTFLEINPYSSGYFAQDYLEGSRQVGDLNATFDYSAALNQQNLEDNSDTVKASIESEYPNRAIITFTNKPVSKYAGSYSTNKGFLSDDIYLQDNYYYQQFSYVIKTDEQFTQYESLVKQTVHPTGMIMFGEFEITNEIDARAAIELLGRLYRNNYQDVVRTDQDIQDFTIIKPIPVDGERATTSQFVYYEFTKPLEDEVLTPDDDFYELTKPLQHFVVTPDFDEKEFTKPLAHSVHIDDDPVFEDLEVVYATEYFGEVYSEGLSVDRSRGFYWNMTKPVVEEMITSETTDYEFTKPVEEEMITSQTVDYELTKPLHNVVEVENEDTQILDITKPIDNDPVYIFSAKFTDQRAELYVYDSEPNAFDYFKDNYVENINEPLFDIKTYKPFEEEFFATEPGIDNYVFTKAVTDELITSEAVSNVFTKSLVDSVNATDDDFSIARLKDVEDPATLSDTTDYEFTKSLEDEVFVTDLAAKAVLKVIKSANDEQQVTDLGIQDIEFGKNIVDEVGVTEDRFYTDPTDTTLYVISDNPNDPDSDETTDTTNYFAGDYIENINVPLLEFNFTKVLEDSINNINEFGTVEINPYSVFYFSESYVEGHTAFS